MTSAATTTTRPAQVRPSRTSSSSEFRGSTDPLIRQRKSEFRPSNPQPRSRTVSRSESAPIHKLVFADLRNGDRPHTRQENDAPNAWRMDEKAAWYNASPPALHQQS